MNIDAFLSPIDGSTPSGEELRNDPRFHEIERHIEPASRESRTDKDGNVSPTSDVDWSAILTAAEDLAGSGRDLRLLIVVCRAMANTAGFAGLADGLKMLTNSLEEYWDSIHPELRERDDRAQAALRRINALKQLENDDHGLLGDLKMGVVLSPRGVGPVTGEDLAMGRLSEFEFMNQIASGLGKSEKEALTTHHHARVARVKTACRVLVAEELERANNLSKAVVDADQARVALQAKFNELAGLTNGVGLDFRELEKFLSRVQGTLDAALEENTGTDDGDADMPANADPSPTHAAATISNPLGAIPGAVNSRGDVEKCLDMIIAFYEHTEPSSPIPHLARRMRKMVPMDFVQLMEEIAPAGMKEFRNVAGTGGDKDN